MKKQNSIGLLEEPDFSSGPSSNPHSANVMAGGGPSEIMLGKFNNTVVLKKGQLTQVLKNTMVLQPPTGPNGVQTNNSVR